MWCEFLGKRRLKNDRVALGTLSSILFSIFYLP